MKAGNERQQRKRATKANDEHQQWKPAVSTSDEQRWTSAMNSDVQKAKFEKQLANPKRLEFQTTMQNSN